MPALMSRNRLPSTSSTIEPAPRLGTNGYARGSDGDVTLASRAIRASDSGPGMSVISFGPLWAAKRVVGEIALGGRHSSITVRDCSRRYWST